ncbi:TonB-dependent receptor [Salinibacter altiplanensis]|uniref:TonB-dependent receptor n=1 Tax=Salinibacter altiplanensis TaxID=1803181 RepID=UPI000C9FD25B|nr:TonB-dependent receptor [Salinibacter altiplanensis]
MRSSLYEPLHRLLLRTVFGVAGVVLLFCTGPSPGHAQSTEDNSGEYTMTLRDVSLETALQRLVAHTGIDLAYSTALVEGRRVYCQRRDAPVEALLRCLLTGTGVDYLRTASGSYLLVESPETPPATGRIAGTVVDAATGEPLPSANVLLADAESGTATNDAGQFTVAPVRTGLHRLVVTYVGYTRAVDSVRVPPNGRDTIRVALTRDVLETTPIVIDGLQQRLPSAGLGAATVDAAALRQPSGQGTPEVLRQVGRRVGVSVNRPLAEVHVQGGNSGEHVTLLDGVPVRKPVSVGRLLSAFSPQALERITVHKAGFGASHGSYTAGVLGASHDLSRSTARYATATADPVSVNGRVDTEWGSADGRSGHAMGAGRTSVWDLHRAASLHTLLNARTTLDRPLTPTWTDAPLPEASAPLSQSQAPRVQFSDVHGAVQQSISPFEQVSVSGYHGRTRLSTDVATVVADGADRTRFLLSENHYDWTNTALQGRYEWMASSRVTGSAQVWGSRHDAHTFYGFRDSTRRTSPDASPPSFAPRAGAHATEGNSVAEWGGRFAMDASLSSSTRLRAAVSPQRLRGEFRVRNRYLGVLSHETAAWQIGSYVEAETTPGLHLTATAGARLTYVPAQHGVYAEPRLSLRYDRADTPLGDLAVRLAGGLYRQYVMQSELSSTGPTSVVPSVQFWLPLDRSVAPPRAYHTAGSLLLTPMPGWTARLETYHKWQPRTLHVDYAGLVHSPSDGAPLPRRSLDDQSAFMASGQGRSYGVAFHLQRDGERVSAQASAAWSRTTRRYPGRFDGRSVPAPWSQPVRLTTDLDVSLVDGFEAHAHWQGTWDRPWALRRAYYDYLARTEDPQDFAPYDLSRPGDQVLAPFSRVDLGLTAKTTLRSLTAEARLNLVNVFDRHNTFDWSLAPAGSRSAPVRRTLPGRRVSLLLELHY